MAHQIPNRLRPSSRNRADDRQNTLGQILEAAGHVFAEKGFDRATGREICEKAGVNTAAINYYFGGVEGLYAAVLEEANNRLFTLEMVSAAVAGKPDAKSKLEALLSLVIGRLAGPVSSSWVLRVVGREIAAPSPMFKALREREFLLKLKILKSIVGDLMGLPVEHPAVARGCVSIMGPCIMLAIADRNLLKRAFPKLGLGPADASMLAKHMVQYAIAGLGVIASEERRNPSI